jgi:hypothetical protein
MSVFDGVMVLLSALVLFDYQLHLFLSYILGKLIFL